MYLFKKQKQLMTLIKHDLFSSRLPYRLYPTNNANMKETAEILRDTVFRLFNLGQFLQFKYYMNT